MPTHTFDTAVRTSDDGRYQSGRGWPITAPNSFRARPNSLGAGDAMHISVETQNGSSVCTPRSVRLIWRVPALPVLLPSEAVWQGHHPGGTRLSITSAHPSWQSLFRAVRCNWDGGCETRDLLSKLGRHFESGRGE